MGMSKELSNKKNLIMCTVEKNIPYMQISELYDVTK